MIFEGELFSDGRIVLLFICVCLIECGGHRLVDDVFKLLFFCKYLVIEFSTNMVIFNLGIGCFI